MALKVLIHEYYWSCPLRLQYKKLLIFWCVCTCVVPSEKGPRDIERWELNWLYSLVQRILNALKIALVYKCLIFEKPHQFYNWKFSFLRLDAIFISFHDCEIIRGIWNKIYIIITVLYIVAYIWIIPGLMLSCKPKQTTIYRFPSNTFYRCYIKSILKYHFMCPWPNN